LLDLDHRSSSNSGAGIEIRVRRRSRSGVTLPFVTATYFADHDPGAWRVGAPSAVGRGRRTDGPAAIVAGHEPRVANRGDSLR